MAESIRKQYQAVVKQEKELQKVKNKNKCNCWHTDSHKEPDLTKKNDGGPYEYMCKECTETIDFTRQTEEEKRKARKSVVNEINILKMMLGDSEEDRKLGKKLARVQYMVEFELEELSKAASKKNARGRKSQSKNEYGVEIERPSVR